MKKKKERNYEKKKPVEGGRFRFTYPLKGLKIVHIGSDVWKIGKVSKVDEKLHQVIYGPENKEYHVWEQDVEYLNEPRRELCSGKKRTINKNGNGACQARTKIYILTHILDKKENWCFDLAQIPVAGKLKVIYENGTVKNIDFDGEFKEAIIDKGFWWYKLVSLRTEHKPDDIIKPVAYRLH